MHKAGRRGKVGVEAIAGQIRACFHRLKALGDDLHQDLGVTAAMRAVLEALHREGEQTVPRIARAKSVTRQHIQIIVNDLLDAGLVRARDNPDDRRSPLISLSSRGRAMFGRIRGRESVVLAELGRALGDHDLTATLATLEALHRWLDLKLRGDRND